MPVEFTMQSSPVQGLRIFRVLVDNVFDGRNQAIDEFVRIPGSFGPFRG
jgi:hypothetical protein